MELVELEEQQLEVRQLLRSGLASYEQMNFVESETQWKEGLMKLVKIGTAIAIATRSDSYDDKSNHPYSSDIKEDHIKECSSSSSSSDGNIDKGCGGNEFDNGASNVELRRSGTSADGMENVLPQVLAITSGLKFACLCRLSLLYKQLNRLLEANIVSKQSLDVAKLHFCSRVGSAQSDAVEFSTGNALLFQLINTLNSLVFDPHDRMHVILLPAHVNDLGIRKYSIEEFKDIRANMVASGLLSDEVSPSSDTLSSRYGLLHKETLVSKSSSAINGNIIGDNDTSNDNSRSNNNNNNNNLQKRKDRSHNSESNRTSAKVIIQANKKPKT